MRSLSRPSKQNASEDHRIERTNYNTTIARECPDQCSFLGACPTVAKSLVAAVTAVSTITTTAAAATFAITAPTAAAATAESGVFTRGRVRTFLVIELSFANFTLDLHNQSQLRVPDAGLLSTR